MSDANKLASKAQELTMEFYALNPDAQSPPLVYAVKEDDIVAVLELNFDNDLAKSLSVLGAALYLKTNQCDASIFVSEAWMAEYATGEAFERPMNNPNRVEVLMCEISTSDHYINVVSKMERDKDGKLTGFSEFQRYDTEDNSTLVGMTSRFDFFEGLPINKETVH